MWKSRSPQVYRYLEKAFVEKFFDTGALRLSSFRKFGKHADEQRLDMHEGVVRVIHECQEGRGHTLFGEIKAGKASYVLCASLIPSRDLMSSFGVDSAIVIHDPVGFAKAVAAHVPGFLDGIDGPCSYQGVPLILRSGPIPPCALEEPINEATVGSFLEELAGAHIHFLKHHSFRVQNEWRFVWRTNEWTQDHLDIVVPEARQFCSIWNNRYQEVLAVEQNLVP